MTLDQIRLGPRLALAFLALMLIGVTNAAVGYWRLEQAHQDFADLQRWQTRAMQAVEWEGHTRLNVNRALVMVQTQADGAAFARLEPRIKETSAEISRLQKELEAHADQPGAKAQFDELAQGRSAYLKVRERLFAMMKAQQPGVGAALETELVPAANAYLEQIGRLRASQQEIVAQQVEVKNASVEAAQTGMLLLSALAVALSLLGAWLITRSVTTPLRRAVDVTAQIAEGDLSRSAPVQGRDEVAQLLGGLARMQDSLRSVVHEVRDTTDSIRTASKEVADGSLDLSSRTENAAASLQQTAAAIEQISASARQNADSAQSANSLAGDARTAAERGGEVVGQVVQTMSEISARSQRITDITGVIDGIAFQTNLLALNAAVEAARAGEHGRGFSVVASEVRALAGRSAEASREIKSLVVSNVDAVHSGTELVAQAGRQMGEIRDAIRRVAAIVGEIATSSAEQSTSVAQVNDAVTHLDQMTQQNAALVEESAAAASSLRDQATRLGDVVAVFRVGDERRQAEALPVAAAS